MPGPFTLAGCIDGGEVYRDRAAITEALIPIVNARDEGAGRGRASTSSSSTSRASPATPTQPEQFLDVIARTVDGVKAYDQHAHVLRQLPRPGGRLAELPAAVPAHLARATVHQLALEFASREMAEIELLASFPTPMDVAVGLVDVKNTWIEPPELVAERLRTVLQVHRRRSGSRSRPTAASRRRPGFIAARKLASMVAGCGWCGGRSGHRS